MKAMVAIVVCLSGCLTGSAQEAAGEPLAPPVPVLQRAKVTLDLHSSSPVEFPASDRAREFVVDWTTPPLLRSLIDAPGPGYREMRQQWLEIKP